MNKIENRKQELITKRWIYNFKSSKELFMKENTKEQNPHLWDLTVDSLDSMIDDLQEH